MKNILIAVWVLLFCCTVAHAEVLWECNFDTKCGPVSSPSLNLADWHSAESLGGSGDIGYDGYNGTGCDIDSAFSCYESSKGQLSSLGAYNYSIDSANPRNVGGKSLACTYEMANNWSGGRLLINLGDTGYEELYVRWYLMFQTGYKVRSASDGLNHKLIRILSNLDNPRSQSTDKTLHDPFDMHKTPSFRTDWDDITYSQPWGMWTSYYSSSRGLVGNLNFTLTNNVSTSDTSITVNEDISATNGIGTIILGTAPNQEYIRYEARNIGTKTFYNLVRNLNGDLQTGTTGDTITTNGWGLGTTTSGGAGGHQAYIIPHLTNITGGIGIGDFNWNPEGHPGTTSDPTWVYDSDLNNGRIYFKNIWGSVVTGDTYPWSSDTSTDYQGNGEWHCIEVHVKMNDIVDGTPSNNFIYEIYIDGTKQLKSTGTAFRKNSTTKFNTIMIPDNMYNQIFKNETIPDPPDSEQYFSIDDIVVSTSYIGPDYVIEGSITSNSSFSGFSASGVIIK